MMTPVTRLAAASLVAAALAVPVPASAAAPSCARVRATIVGTPGDDHLQGTAGDDVIVGLGGKDVIDGKGGDDVLCGNAGDDQLVSTDGHDLLLGGVGDDFVGSFENPLAWVSTGRGDDFVSVQAGSVPGWGFDGGPGRDHVFLNLTLELHEARPMRGLLDLPAAKIVLHPRGGKVDGRFASWEELDLPNSVRWDAYGTDADERFLFEGTLPIRVHSRGGDDEIIGTPRADVIVAGDGDDTVTAYAGIDVCRGAEHTRGCDVITR